MDAVQPTPAELRQDGLCGAHHQPQPTSAAHYGSDDRLGYSRPVPVTVRPWRLYIDADLTMRTHVQRIASRGFAVLRRLRSIGRYVPTSVFRSLVSAFVLNRLDYCNSLLVDLPANLLQRLQSVQNSATRLIYRLRRSEHITDTLLSLHWLRVRERDEYKVAVLTYKALKGVPDRRSTCLEPSL